MRFTRFVAVDWSGARGPHLPGVQVAECRAGDAAPRLVRSPGGGAWRRSALFEWLAGGGLDEGTLLGFDFSFTFPYVDRGAYFPGAPGTPSEALALWRLVERVCRDDAEFYAGTFTRSAPWRDHFRTNGYLGRRFVRRHKLVEARCQAQGLGAPESVFHLIGAKQVGMGSLAGMRFLLAIRTAVPRLTVWPMDPLPQRGPVAAEVFPRLFLKMAGHGNGKVRSVAALNRCLKALGSDPIRARTVTDDEADALITTVGLRAIAGEAALWRPAGLTRRLARTEGWVLGVR
ncbi:MAG: hypothetical protein FJX65_14935 [Alphaproteobacteria bacterium]|nr:hypothetical protein [Alphaproteobacteria bacterium]